MHTFSKLMSITQRTRKKECGRFDRPSLCDKALWLAIKTQLDAYLINI